MQNKSSRVFLLLALVLGILATVATLAVLENVSAKEGPKTMLVVASRDLRPNMAIDPEKDFREIPIDVRLIELLKRTVPSQSKAGFKGQKTNRYVLAGTPVWLADLGTGTIDIQLSGDQRALAIPAKGANAVGGLLVPGDYVKLYVTRPVVRTAPVKVNETDPAVPMPQATGQWQTEEVLAEPVKVLAVGARLSKLRSAVTAAEAYQATTESESQQTVTLEVTEAQAKVILAKTGAGQLAPTLLVCPGK